MQQLLIATNNQGKQREYRRLLSSISTTICFPSDLRLVLDVAEDGDSFYANAKQKALANARASGLWTLADDSGLEVDALGGAPGVHSARYGPPGASDAERYQALLFQLAAVSPEQRTARFRCVLVLVGPADVEYSVEGVCQGSILPAPRGKGGFGYDPVFYLPKEGKTLAEMSADEKNRISHRALAVEQLLPILTHVLESVC